MTEMVQCFSKHLKQKCESANCHCFACLHQQLIENVLYALIVVNSTRWYNVCKLCN
jgi:hypothetical protein